MNYLRGDDMPPGFETTELLRGRPVVCLRPDSPLAALDAVGTDSLLAEPLVVMRSGYVMHRFLHRLLGGRTPVFSYSTDGAEMGKLMVAEGPGATVLPDFSVVGDPLEESPSAAPFLREQFVRTDPVGVVVSDRRDEQLVRTGGLLELFEPVGHPGR
ncbi:DNA-binding transcriptional LysR family regulator [Streptomyces albaduncus]|uniref:DNA-binding transcriptional LysR family regulator n=1 Tax=Streptomyces griseoloalbus TaxID=67303 RepID=A0A7W8FAI0_9ACTN|nr:DNA-binding transcriptional LysR family regulator [Streptomyces albaduncus]